MENNVLKIVTHNTNCHCDEVAGTALLALFINENIEVTRVPHFKNIEDVTDPKILASINEADFVLDTSGHYDGIKYMDHHQFKHDDKEDSLWRKSSAGLVLMYLEEKGYIKKDEYPELRHLIDIIDKNDTGQRISLSPELPWLVAQLNSAPYAKINDNNFNLALSMVLSVFKAVKYKEEIWAATVEKYKNTKPLENFPFATYIGESNDSWYEYYNNVNTPDTEFVIYYSPEKKAYVIRALSMPGTYERKGRSLVPDSMMKFVHQGGFYASALDMDTIEAYLNKYY